MRPEETAKAYQHFFYQTEAGKQFLEFLSEQEASHIHKAQQNSSINELDRSYGYKDVAQHISTTVAQVAGQQA